MEHAEAIETNAPDRYLLGQLSAAEADAFEEHYFDCITCAEDVRLGMSFLEGGRRLVREPAAPPAVAPVVPIDSHPRRRGFRWIPAAAVAAILAIPINIGLLMRMQSAAVPALSVVGAEFYWPGPVRDASAPIEVQRLPEGLDVELAVTVTPAKPYPHYEARVLRGNKTIMTRRLGSRVVENTVKIVVPDPGPGTYDLVIVGIEPAGETEEIVRHRFEVTR